MLNADGSVVTHHLYRRHTYIIIAIATILIHAAIYQQHQHKQNSC
ncbi:hypothetical protein EVA_06840 [gut metagenome]|uniref:Uncharacterized protein n=1 Tax=gut metagenome TaxID=749906 RepID=J9GRB8_9ZZZZ